MTIRYADTEDLGLPDVRTLSNKVVRVRKQRTLKGCGHEVRPGDIIYKWVGLIDYQFTTQEQCSHCTWGDGQ